MSTGDTAICFNCMRPLEGETVCSNCGHDSETEHNPDYRRPGSLLVSRYLVGWLRHKNGDSALYKGYDRTQKTTVWIKEYFPRTIAKRDTFTGKVSPQEGYEAQYKALMSDFVDLCNEVRRLSVSDPVIPIDDVFAEDNTVYAIYRDLHTVSLETYLGKKGGKLPAEDALELLLPFYNTISNMHARGEIHRGISPYTVFIDPREQKLYLWGFALSATRTGGSELDAELFNGYSAPEQYSSNGWQGTWTDVYACAALLYRTVSGFVPPKSVMISGERPLASLFDLVMDISMEVSNAVEDAMQLETEERTQSINTFTSRLIERSEENTAVYDTSKVVRSHPPREQRQHPPPHRRRRQEESGGVSFKYIFLALLLTVMVLGGVLYFTATTFFPELISGVDIASNSSSRPSSSAPMGESDDGSYQEESRSESEAADTRVPRFIGMEASAVESNQEYLQRFEFTVEEDYNDEYSEGQVYGQAPDAGTDMPNRGNVILYVSKGKLILTMPDLTGMTLEEVDELLAELAEEHGMEPEDLTYSAFQQYRSDVEEDQVVSTYPSADTEFDPKRTPITIYVSKGTSTAESAESPSNSSTPSNQQSSASQPSSSSSRVGGQKDEYGIDM